MISENLIRAALAVGLASFMIGAVWRIRLWRAKGGPASVDVVGGLIALPKRYFVDLHHVVMRDRFSAVMHMFAAGAFLVIMVLLSAIYLMGIDPNALRIVLIMMCLFLGVGAAMDVCRRIARPQGRSGQLSEGPWRTFSYALLAMAVALAMHQVMILAAWANPAALMVTAGASAIAIAYLVGHAPWRAPLKHAFAGALNLAYHPRQDRFHQDRPAPALAPLNLDAERLGAQSAQDFSWNRLLNFDACVQCGRCEAACPAFAAGQPLNPKRLVQDLVESFAPKWSDAGYFGSPHPPADSGAEGRSGKIVSDKTVWACTTCRACVHECPMMIEHVDAVVDLRRHLTLVEGGAPDHAAEALESLEATDNIHGADNRARFQWAVDLKLPLMRDVLSTEYLLWVGEGAFELRNQRTLRALIKLLRAANVKFAILGDEEYDCGDIARRLGDEATFQALAKRNIETLSKYQFETIVTADPHVLNCLNNEYRHFGGKFDVVHHTTLLAELLRSGRLPGGAFNGAVTYHDPCYLGRYNGEFNAPREILDALGAKRVEMERSRERSRCCGGGGGAPLTDIPGARRIPDIRMADAVETNAQTLAVACPQCALMLEGVGGPRLEVKDVAELLYDAIAL